MKLRPAGSTFGLLGVTAAVAALDAALALSIGQQPAAFYTLEIVAALVWAGAGALAVVLRADSPGTGRLMQLLALILVVDAPAGFDLASSHPGVAAVQVSAHAVQPFQIALFAHVLLSYPGGRLRRLDERVVIGAVHGWAAVVAVVSTLRTVVVVTAPGWHGERPPGSITGGPPSSVPMNALWLMLAVAYLVVLFGKVRRATRRERRVLAYPFASAALILPMFLAAVGLSSIGVDARIPLALLAVLVGPGAFLAGLVRERLSYGSLAELVHALERTPVDQLQESLRKVLRDRHLRLGYGRDGSYVDLDGAPLAPERGQVVRRIGDEPDGAVVLHDLSLNEEPELLGAAAGATRLALENARLTEVIRAQLADLRTVRRRVVESGVEQRRRLERDLHDGAQQRIYAVGLVLGLLERHLGEDTVLSELVAEARSELLCALDELRDLARGIHPAVLTDDGLVAAVRTLVRRMPIPVTLSADLTDRPEPAAESAMYFAISEALTNIVKHADARRAEVRLYRDGDRLRVEVNDDGVGGADPRRGTGLRGLADRAAAFDGTLTIGPAHPSGTRILAEVRCDWSSSMTPG
ncbi:histidine kinase [Nocardia takedensis]